MTCVCLLGLWPVAFGWCGFGFKLLIAGAVSRCVGGWLLIWFVGASLRCAY